MALAIFTSRECFGLEGTPTPRGRPWWQLQLPLWRLILRAGAWASRCKRPTA